MSRGPIPGSVLDEIESRLPRIDSMQRIVHALDSHPIALVFEDQPEIAVAAPCFQDCATTLHDVRYALVEHFAHGTYYRDFADPRNDLEAIRFEKYYLDDAALRLYSASEHLAHAIRCMLNLRAEDLPRQEKTSVAQRLSILLRLKFSLWPLTRAVIGLGESSEWSFARKYRNDWVHNQPPTISGTGASRRRINPWHVSADGTKKLLLVTLSDEPEYTIGTVAGQLLAGYKHLLNVVELALTEYRNILRHRRIEVSELHISYVWPVGPSV